MSGNHEPLIVSAVGHLGGAIVFGIFLVLALRSGTGQRSIENRLSVMSAALAWLWNAGSFAILVLPAGHARWILEAVGFSSLSLLPALLLHLSLGAKFRIFLLSGYAMSAVAIAMHLTESFFPSVPLHRWALWTNTIGFGVLTVVAAAGVLLEGGRATRARTSQILASMCLLLFAVTFSHFGTGQPPYPWSKELLVHHAGIPLALLILLQDYRFVFLDAFLRFLANVFLAALMGLAALRIAIRLVPEDISSHPLADTVTVASLCGLLVLFAYLRGVVQRWFTKVVFRHGDVEGTIRELRMKAAECQDESAFLSWAGGRLAVFASSPRFEIIKDSRVLSGSQTSDVEHPSVADNAQWLRLDPGWNWVEAAVPIRLSQRDARWLLLGRRQGGRRYMSEDLRALDRLTASVVEEVERFRSVEMERLVSQAELRALQSQINPHFLFNALNTIYGIIPREAAGARRTVLNLSDIFRYYLQSDKMLIPLSEELKIVRAYLDIERLRLGPRLQTAIQVDKCVEEALIPILSVQPLVENAIKHGLAVRSEAGWLRLRASLVGGCLQIVVEDSGADDLSRLDSESRKGAGVGLANVTRRLQLCFGPDAGVQMQKGGFGTRVQFSVPLSAVPAHQ